VSIHAVVREKGDHVLLEMPAQWARQVCQSSFRVPATFRRRGPTVRNAKPWLEIAQLEPIQAAQTESQVMVTRVGLKIPKALDYNSWQQAGLKISRIADASAWCLGDWLIYGQSRHPDRYREAIAVAHLDYQTLRNYAWVARRFELGRRRDRLSLQHHAEVASLPSAEQDRWLDLAEKSGWSRNELRRNIRADRDGDGHLGHGSLLRLKPPAEHVAVWREAAERVSQNLEEWIIATLDDRAAEDLSPVTMAGAKAGDGPRDLLQSAQFRSIGQRS